MQPGALCGRLVSFHPHRNTHVTPTIAVQYTTGGGGQTSIGCPSREDALKKARKILSDWMRERKEFRDCGGRWICVRVVEDDGGWPGGRVIVRYRLSRDHDWI